MSLNSNAFKILKKWLLPIALGWGMLCLPAQDGFSQSRPFISVMELEQALKGEQLAGLIEVSRQEVYRQGHIPGAVNVWRPDYEDKSYPFEGVRSPRDSMEVLLKRLGVTSGKPLVLYDERGNLNTARLRWILRGYGFPGPVFLLKGGKQAWKRAGFSFTGEVPAISPSTFHFPEGSPPPADPSGLAFAQSAFADPAFKIIDCRTEGEFTGQTIKNGAGRAGRIPGAIHFDYKNLMVFEGDEYLGLLPESEMRGLLNRIGLNPEDKIMIYCHSGVRSAHLAMVMTEVLGYHHVTNYDGSWVEWSHHPDLPTESGPAPALPIAAADTSVLLAGPPAPSGLTKYSLIVQNSYSGFWKYLRDEVTLAYNYKPKWLNFFYGLIAISLFFFGLELWRPWRPDQPRFRKDFWLDAFYMFFNFFLFGLIIFMAVQNVFTELFNDFLGLFGVTNIVAVRIDQLPVWAYFGILFVVADFINWWTHRLLHRVDWLWQFHKVHHSVEEMGFAAHLRYHWMENVVYKGIQAIPLTMLGYNLVDLGILHLFNLAWGHFNHSNIHVPTRVSGAVLGGLLAFGLGSLYPDQLSGVFPSIAWPVILLSVIALGLFVGYFVLRYAMRYLFNSPEMHLWHHAHELPGDKPYGVNFGLTLAIWDWIFGTVYWPHDRGDVKLGFPGLAKFPKSFWGQLVYGIWKK